MRIYYFDDAGQRAKNNASGDKYFVLGGFGIDADRVPLLKAKVTHVASEYGMPLVHPTELKFNHVGRSSDNKPSKPHWMIRAGLKEPNQRRALVYSVLREATSVPSVETFVVATELAALRGDDKAIVKTITPLLERVQMNCQIHGSQGMVLMDEEQAANKELREFMRGGSQFFKYRSLLDTICFMPSEESPGVQVADLIAGAAARFLNHQDPGYMRTLARASARDRSGETRGCGLKLYPRGTFPFIPGRQAPWSSTDLAIHAIEDRHVGGNKLVPTTNGLPSYVWARDTDTIPQ